MPADESRLGDGTITPSVRTARWTIARQTNSPHYRRHIGNGFLRPRNREYANSRNPSRVRCAAPCRRALDRTRLFAEPLPNTRAKEANRTQQPRSYHRLWIIRWGQASTEKPDIVDCQVASDLLNSSCDT